MNSAEHRGTSTAALHLALVSLPPRSARAFRAAESVIHRRSHIPLRGAAPFCVGGFGASS